MLVAVAAYHDLKARRVPNTLVLLGSVLAVVLSLSMQTPSFRQMLEGAAVGLMLLLPFYLVGKMGAGDVKLMAIVGAFLGVKGALVSALLAMLAGGILALWFLAFRLGNRLPYAVAIFAGVTGYAVMRCNVPGFLYLSLQGV
ncbi:MAG: prepilin peptidase [Betaproteobacteria bacterium]|nr:prepilin peptidase [Betaproteobacteria bacterium]MDE2621867.1 prepilin peptidase [Betaproteobacteria bacterium]